MTTPALAAGTRVLLVVGRPPGAVVSAPSRAVVLADGRLGLVGDGLDLAALASDPRVRVTACDARGRVAADAASYDGTAVVVRSGAAYLEVRGRLRERDGVRVVAARLLDALVHPGREDSTVVVIVSTTSTA